MDRFIQIQHFLLKLAQAVHEGIMDAEIVRNIPELHSIWGDELDDKLVIKYILLHT